MGYMNENRSPLTTTITDEEREYITKRRALYRKVVDCLDGCGLSVSAAAGVLRDVMSQMFVCQKDEPVADILDRVKKSRFYQDS